MPETLSLARDLALVVVEPESKRRWARRIVIEPLRPENYVDAEAEYDPDRQQIRIRVARRDGARLPAEGTSVAWQVGPEVDPQAQQAIAGELSDVVDQTVLFAGVPLDPTKTVTVHLTVDGYPRALAFQVPTGSRQRRRPRAPATELKIQAPAREPRPVYRVPEQESLPLEFRADAVIEFFENGGFIEAGLDVDRSGTVDRGIERFFSDRHVGLELAQATPNGEYAIATRVTDFAIELPCRGLLNQEVRLLARMVSGDGAAPSGQAIDSVNVILDGEPPRLRVVAPNTIQAGNPLTVQVTAEDALSHVSRVEAAVDVDRVGHFGEAKPLPAAFDTRSGTWQLPVPTDDLQAGQPYTLLVRATDAVGNTSPLAKHEFRVMAPPPTRPGGEGSPRPRQPTSRDVTGIVSFRGAPVGQADVELEGSGKPAVKADAQGRFAFRGIAAGEYTLKANGVAQNRFRSGEQQVKVVIPPTEPLVIRLQVD